MSIVTADLMPQQHDLFVRLQSGVLPVEGRALVAAGHNVGFVRSLFPMSANDVRMALVSWLADAVVLEDRADGARFHAHVAWVASRCNVSQGSLAWTFSLNLRWTEEWAGIIVEELVHAGSDEAAVVGLSQLLAQVVEVLSVWVVAGGLPVFTSEQQLILEDVVRLWFAVLDFGGEDVE